MRRQSRRRSRAAVTGCAMPHAEFRRAARKARGPVALLIGAAALVGIGAAEARAPVAVPGADAAVYDLYYGGVFAGSVQLDMQQGADGRYSVAASGEAAGYISTFVGGRFSAAATGEGADATRATPERFEAEGSFLDDELALTIAFDGGRVASVAADPPFDPKPWQIEPTAQAGVLDPLAAVALLSREREGGEICDVSAEIYDGRRRVRATLGAPERVEATGEMRCEATISRVAGFKPKMMAKDDIALRLYFDEGPDGARRLRSVYVPLEVGAATAVRRDG